MDGKVSEETFSNTPNPQLYLAIHEAVDQRTNVSLDRVPEEKHERAIREALERKRMEESGGFGPRIDEFALGYDKEQIEADGRIVESYVNALRDIDRRDKRQLAKDALIESHLEGDEMEDYDVILQGLNIPDKGFVHPNSRPGYEDVSFPDHRTQPGEVTADFMGINQDTNEIRAVRILDGKVDSDQMEEVFRNAQIYVNSNEEYRDFSLEYEFVPAASFEESNPMPGIYTGNIHYNGSEDLDPDTRQVIDDLASRDVEEMYEGRSRAEV